MLEDFLSDESGASAIEYGIIIAVLSIAMISSYSMIKDGIWGLYKNVSNGLNNV